MANAHIIGIDWGSTHVRAFRFDENGTVQATRSGARGAAGLAPADFEGVLVDLLGDWLAETPAKIVICGMAGSREGWLEAPYLPCPCTLPVLSNKLVHAPSDLPVYLVPGLSVRNLDGVPDVLRGEETQILGAIDTSGAAWAITPGTHSKWAQLTSDEVSRFHTYMTGEIYNLMATRSVLARQMDVAAPPDDAAFDRGVARALEGGALPRLLFGVRTEALLGDLAREASASYLSGLLIGAEIADAARCAPLTAPLMLIGAPSMTSLYRRALLRAGANHITVIDGEAAAARGLWRLANAGRAT